MAVIRGNLKAVQFVEETAVFNKGTYKSLSQGQAGCDIKYVDNRTVAITIKETPGLTQVVQCKSMTFVQEQPSADAS